MNLLDIDTQKIYHYGSQDVNDFGWGCVYRSVQTLRSLEGLPVPSIPQMQQDIGIDPTGSGRDLWIEPVDTRRYIPGENTLAMYTSVDQPENHMLRTSVSDFDVTFTDREKAEGFLLTCLNNNKRVVLDDTIASYLLTGIVDSDYIIIDPHVTSNNIRTMSKEDFFRRAVWMMLC